MDPQERLRAAGGRDQLSAGSDGRADAGLREVWPRRHVTVKKMRTSEGRRFPIAGAQNVCVRACAHTRGHVFSTNAASGSSTNFKSQDAGRCCPQRSRSPHADWCPYPSTPMVASSIASLCCSWGKPPRANPKGGSVQADVASHRGREVGGQLLTPPHTRNHPKVGRPALEGRESALPGRLLDKPGRETA